jgi:hypothetical protein
MTASYPTMAANNAASGHKIRAAELGLRLTSTGSCPRKRAGLPHLEQSVGAPHDSTTTTAAATATTTTNQS